MQNKTLVSVLSPSPSPPPPPPTPCLSRFHFSFSSPFPSLILPSLHLPRFPSLLLVLTLFALVDS